MIYNKNAKKTNERMWLKPASPTKPKDVEYCCCCCSCRCANASVFTNIKAPEPLHEQLAKNPLKKNETRKVSMLAMYNDKLCQCDDVPVKLDANGIPYIVKDPPSSSITIGNAIRPIPLRNVYLETEGGGEDSDSYSDS